MTWIEYNVYIDYGMLFGLLPDHDFVSCVCNVLYCRHLPVPETLLFVDLPRLPLHRRRRRPGNKTKETKRDPGPPLLLSPVLPFWEPVLLLRVMALPH
jgi:hypothetical protein